MGCEFSQELPIPECTPPHPIHLDEVLVVLFHFHYHWTKSQISYTSMYTGNVHGIWLYLSLALYFNYNADIP